MGVCIIFFCNFAAEKMMIDEIRLTKLDCLKLI